LIITIIDIAKMKLFEVFVFVATLAVEESCIHISRADTFLREKLPGSHL